MMIYLDFFPFFFFIENLFPNLTMELYFLMQLLTSRSIDMELIAVCGEGKKHLQYLIDEWTLRFCC